MPTMEKRIKWSVLIGSLFLTYVAGYFYVHSYKELIHFNNFPVPGNAINTKNIANSKVEEFTWNAASEENGIPKRYLAVIRLNGWKDTTDQGSDSTITFEKNGMKIDILTSTDYLYVAQQPQ
jgi:hypothetical protein